MTVHGTRRRLKVLGLASEEYGGGSMARIVVVSDDPDIRCQTLQALDREHDITACARPSAAQAAALRDSAPDVVILDADALFDPVDVLGPAARVEKMRSAEST